MENDERRRVAEKLRASIPGDGVMRRGDKGWSLLYRTIFGRYMHNQSAGRTYSEVAGRLADLIDPDTTTDTTKTPTDTTKCDREALLALADELEEDACWEVQTPGDTSGAWRLKGACDRIREALGVDDA